MIVGLVGRMRSGKDTAAAALVRDRGFRRDAFADDLRGALLAVNPIVWAGDPDDPILRLADVVDGSPESWEAAKGGPWGLEVRRLMQGMSAMRGVDPAIWLRPVLRRAEAFGGHTVISDVRFLNEAAAIRDAGGLLLRVKRPGNPFLIEAPAHVSELEVDRIATAATVLNVGTVEAFQARVCSMVDGWLGGVPPVAA